MTVYELIQELITYEADAVVTFDIGKLSASHCTLQGKNLYYGGVNHPEVHVELEE
ncbi:MAG TPA: hypothetical protein PLT28_00130 [Saprospiraceae bacterium]|nr:hypothetical protein [Saprospiraceae bacterium]